MRFATVHLLAPSVRMGDATSNHTFALVRLLAAEGAEPTIWCSRPPGTQLPEEMRGRVRVVHYADYTPNADLTILQYPAWFPLAERFRQVRGPAVFWYHGVTPPEFATGETGRDPLINAQFRTELAWYAHLAVAASPYTAAELHRHAAYPQERIRVVPLGINTAQFSRTPPAALVAQARRQWRLEGKRVLLYIGRIAGNKRIDLLIRAVARLIPRHPDLHLLIVGSTAGDAATQELHARLVQQAADLGIADHVTFTGHVDQIESYLHLAELFLLASQHEGFGAPLVEAMAAGVPIVASASGAIPWVLDSGGSEEAGLLFPAGDAATLAHAVELLLTQPALAAALAAKGRRRAEAYNLTRFRQRVLAVLEEVADQAQRDTAPAGRRALPALYRHADVALRAAHTRPALPIAGRLVEWLRANATIHLKELYLDRIVERQVNYNRLAAYALAALQDEVTQLQARLAVTGHDSAQ